ncbi:hypothetical protein TNCV_2737921, partial [Trichonephila clavipes]
MVEHAFCVAEEQRFAGENVLSPTMYPQLI